MLKKIQKITMFFILISTLVQGTMSFAEDLNSNGGESPKMKGIWVASVYGIDYPKKATTNVEGLKAEADAIIQTAVDAGMNAIFLQVRPTGDALYNSEIFPWSKFLTGKEGLAPEGEFDPLEYWIEEAHKNKIELHAWINPYRVTRDMSKDVKDPFALLSKENPARLHPEWVAVYTDGNLYYNPGMPEVEGLILSGVKELITHYDIDGIHFDDYFYPGTDFEDTKAYEAFRASGESIGDFRRRSVTHMIESVNALVKSLDENVAFGVSPFGIWANQSSKVEGSATRGNESYFSHYADTKDWVERGILDYIAPQIYWHMGFEIADYEILTKWWSDLVEGKGVDLIIGQGAYRTQYTDETKAWYGTAEIENQLDFNRGLANYKGSIFYNYSAFKNNPDLVKVVREGLPTSIASQLFPRYDTLLTLDRVTLSLYAPEEALVNTNIFGRYYFFKKSGVSDGGGLVKYEVEVPKSAFKGNSEFRPTYRVRLNGVNYDLVAPGIIEIQ